jgi:glycosyltransferase involved in cell wall biosynthesis/peptidoglycan/xylan/chitin deacetylase (PgdA/CDA1 family)
MANVMPLRIGIIMDHPSPHMVGLLNALAERDDCSAEVIYLGSNAPERRWEAPGSQLPHRFLKGLTLMRGGLRINVGLIHSLRQMRVDVWLLNSVYSSPSTLIAAWVLSRGSTPWVYMNEPPRPRNQLFSTFKLIPFRFVVRRAWGIIGMGEKTLEIYRSFLDGNRPMTSIPYSIHLDDFFQLHLPVAPSDPPQLRFLTCCQMIHRKGLDILLQACEQLRDMNWQLTLVGDGPLRHKLEREFSHSFPQKQVIFRGEVCYEKRHEAFADQHIFVFPSRWDGWGMVVPEAMAAGLPVIATDQVIAAHEFIRSGINGFLIPANDSQALADKMSYFIHYSGNIPQMASAARQRIKEFRPEVGAKRLIEFLADLVGRNNGFSLENLSQKTRGCAPSWKTLTAPDSIPKYAWREIRQRGKGTIILLHNGLKPKAKPRGHRILMYHLVLKEDRKSFEEQVKFLTEHFVVCSIPEIIQDSVTKEGSSAFRAAITFDDGFRVLMGDCLEILERHNIKASFFIPTGFVELADQPEMAARFSLKTHYYNFPLEPMGPEDLQTLVKLGHEIGSHGVSHIGLGSMSGQRVIRELEQSAQRIEQWTDIRPAGFAYPYGHTVSVLSDPTQWFPQAGYYYGLTQKRGSIHTSSNPFLLPREHAEGNWSVHDLRFFLMK